ncbi:MAG: metallophosphoesterase family protein [Baekduia sp.]
MPGTPVAIVADVHGNLPALEAVLADAAVAGAGLVVSAGDVVSGPMGGECLELLARWGGETAWVMGNADRNVIEAFDARAGGRQAPESAHPIDLFAARRLEPHQRELLDSFLPAVRVDDVLVCHGTPGSDEGIVTKRSSLPAVSGALAESEFPVVVGGHVHHQFRVDIEAGSWINAGSVGMPYEGAPGAYWLLLSGEIAEFRRSTYDLPDALARIARTEYPAYDELTRILRGDITADDAAEAFESR